MRMTQAEFVARAKELYATKGQDFTISTMTLANRIEAHKAIQDERRDEAYLATLALEQYLLRLHIEAAIIHNLTCRAQAAKDGVDVTGVPVALPPPAQ